MITRLITLLLLLALTALSADARPRTFWIGREGLGLGKLGAAGSKGSNGIAPVGCTTTGLIFTLPCNTQYLF